MARKSLSSQVIEELDRARGILSSLQDSSDPIPGILIGSALESLHRIESMCLAARQGAVDAVLTDTPLGTAFGPDKLAQAQHKAPRKTTRSRK